MSYDIFVQNVPDDAKTIEDIPADFKPASIGKRAQIIEKILEVVPGADFSDPTWGRIRGEDWSVEINIGAEEDCSGFAFHLRGGDLSLGIVDAILQALNLRGLDPQAGSFFVARAGATDSFRRWRAYRSQIADGTQR